MIHIHITLQVVGLIEISFRVTLSTAEMHKVDTVAWAYTYVRVSLHVRPRELTRTYVWNEGLTEGF